MLYGEEPVLADPEPFLASMNAGEIKIAVTSPVHRQKDVLLGVSAEYTMSNGETCTALVASLPVDYIAETLSLYSENTLVYSHIIRRDGTFVIRTGDAFRENYFDRIQALFEEQGRMGNSTSRTWRPPWTPGRNTPPFSPSAASGGTCNATSSPTPSGTW